MERYTEVCGDNRFELIEKYKEKLVKATNIETSKEEMDVIDNILFRFWQMGWLDKLEADVVPRSEVERLTIELEAMRGAANSYKMHYEKAKQEFELEIFKQAFDYPTLADWYISSVDDRDTPVWTDEHIEELLNDFYVIPKEIADGYKV